VLSVTVTELTYVPPAGLNVGVATCCCTIVNVAVTDFAALMVTVHVVPEVMSHPLQLAKVDPLAALAVRVTVVPLG
jgi:hypothetical protein